MTSTRTKMSLPRFNLKDSRSKNSTLIYLIYRYKRDQYGKLLRFKYSTGKKVIPKYFNNGLAKESLHHPEYKELNSFLRNLTNEVQRIVNLEPLISHHELKKRLDAFCGYGRSNINQVHTLLDYIDVFISKSTNDARTLLKYKGVKSKLNDYSVERNIVLTFDKIRLDFKNDFVNWLYDNGVQSQNTVSKIISTVVQFMKAAAIDKTIINGEYKPYHNETEYLRKDFKVSRIKTSKHFLSQEELIKLYNYDLKDNPTYKRVKDLFLISCYTGLRISDLQRLKRHHIIEDKEGKYIDIHTFKGRKSKFDNEVVIPILPDLQLILEEYNFEIPDPISEQKHNDYIKVILRDAKIDRKVIHKENVKGEMVETAVPIFEKITNHSGRYTFINFMINDYNVPLERVQKMTGQSMKVLQGYERGDKKNNAKKVLKTILTQFPKNNNVIDMNKRKSAT